MNRLYYGDNLDVLRRHITDASVDLVYLDPPFNSNASYNVLFAERDGARAASQIKAFEDTWKWDESAARACVEVIEGGGKVSEAMQAFRTFLGGSDMMAYLAMMAPRLVELRRVLKPTGSIYLHCDPTASHYLKMLLDAIFGARNFRNEIIWKRTLAHGSARRFAPVHDVILFYSVSDTYTWTRPLIDHDDEYLAKKYRFDDERGRYRLVVLTGPGVRHGQSGQPWRGYDPTASGRHWTVPSRALEILRLEGQEIPEDLHRQLDLLHDEGFVRFPKKRDGGLGVPEFKLYLPSGQPVPDVIADIAPINSQAVERLGYPTQKPEELLNRLVLASTNEGEVVLDPFCGCGTAVASAQRLKREWIGIDITSLAISLIRHRLADAFGDQAKYEVLGEPVSLPDAQKLAGEDPYQFQWWALGLVGARPAEGKKGADKGIDGRIYFHEGLGGKPKQIIFSVKAGHVTASQVRDLRGVIEREHAAIGVLLCIEEPTGPMRKEAANAGFYDSVDTELRERYPRLQILTIEDLLTGKTVQRPPSSVTFKRAPKATPVAREQQTTIWDSDDHEDGGGA